MENTNGSPERLVVCGRKIKQHDKFPWILQKFCKITLNKDFAFAALDHCLPICPDNKKAAGKT